MGCQRKNIYILFISSLPILYYLANLYAMLKHFMIPYLIIGYLTGLIGLFEMLTNHRLNRRLLLTVLFLYVLSGIIEVLIIGNGDIGDVIRGSAFYCIIGVLFAYPFNYFQGLVLFIITILSIGLELLSGNAIHEILLNSSGNYISVLLILSLVIYFIGLDNAEKDISIIDLIAVVIVLLMSIWARGRSGIIAATFILVCVLLYYIKPHNGKVKSKMFYVFHFFLIIGICYIIWYMLDTNEDILNLDKFERLGMDSNGRDDIFAGYLNSVSNSIIFFIFGAPLNDIPQIREMELNPHNSFILLHAYNGIMMVIVFFAFFIKSLKFYLKNNFLLFAMTVALFIRGMTDIFIFGTYGMPAIMYLTFKPYINKNN